MITDWVSPGSGSTPRELLNRFGSLLHNASIRILQDAPQDFKTRLAIVRDGDAQPYDVARVLTLCKTFLPCDLTS